MERTLTALVAAETEGRRIVEEAERQAKEIREQTEEETTQILEEAKRQEEEEIQQAMEESRKQALLARKEILDRAEEQAKHWEELFQKNHDQSINFIIKAVTALLGDNSEVGI